MKHTLHLHLLKTMYRISCKLLVFTLTSKPTVLNDRYPSPNLKLLDRKNLPNSLIILAHYRKQYYSRILSSLCITTIGELFFLFPAIAK